MEDAFNSLKMEYHLNFWKRKTTSIFDIGRQTQIFKNGGRPFSFYGRRPQFFLKMEDDIIFFENGHNSKLT